MLQPSHRMVTPSVKEMHREDWRGLGSAPPSRIACYLEGERIPSQPVRTNLVLCQNEAGSNLLSPRGRKGFLLSWASLGSCMGSRTLEYRVPD